MPRKVKSGIGHLLIIVVLATAAVALYVPTLDYPFAFDDFVNIKNNRNLRISRLGVEELHDAATQAVNATRPVSMISFALNYYFSGYEVRSYRMTNIVIHAVNGILIYLLCFLTLNLVNGHAARKAQERDESRLCSDDEQSIGMSSGRCPLSTRNPPSRHLSTESRSPLSSRTALIAFVAALVWVVHPVQTQSVIYIVQRMNSLAVLFYLCSLSLYILGRTRSKTASRWLCFGAALATGVLALGSKEIAFTLPVIIVLYEWYFFQKLNPGWWARSAKYVAPVLVVMGALAWLRLSKNPFAMIVATYDKRDFTLGERLLTQFRVVVHYISLLFFPDPERLNLDYDFPVSSSFFSPVSTVLCLALLLALLGVAVYVARAHPLLSFCILWFYINLAIESSVIALEMVFEHRLYLPSVMLILAAIVVVERFAPVSGRGKLAGAAILVGLLCLGTSLRSRVWRDPITLWSDCVGKSPNKARPNNDLGLYLSQAGRLDEAVTYLRKSLEIRPNYYLAHNNVATALREQDKIDEAIEHFSEALRIKPEFFEAHLNLGNLLAMNNRLTDGIAHLRRAGDLEPGDPLARLALGNALTDAGELDAAIAAYNEALRLQPSYLDAHMGLGNALAAAERKAEAAEQYRLILQRDPNNRIAHNNLGIVLADLGRMDEARAALEQSAAVDPTNTLAHLNVGILLARQGKLDDAVSHFQGLLDADPQDTSVQLALASVYLDVGRNTEARRHFERAVEIDPNHPRARRALGKLLSRMNDFEAAVPHFEHLAERHPDDLEARLDLADAWRDLGKAEQALVSYAQVLKRDPDQVRARFAIGRIRLANDRPAEAVAHFEAVVRREPGNKAAHNNLGAALARSGKPDRAVAIWQALLQLDPQSADAHVGIGNVQLDRGDMDTALAHYTKALEIDTGSGATHRYVGEILIRQGNYDEALSHFQTALAIDPDNTELRRRFAAAHVERANRFMGAGGLRDAIRHYEAALIIQPGTADAHNNLGAAHGQLGNLEVAVKHFAEAVRIEPDFIDAKRNLEAARRMHQGKSRTE